ncbi:MAG: hypothetical protein V2A73_23100 [Pseudomonadota bacterium]
MVLRRASAGSGIRGLPGNGSAHSAIPTRPLCADSVMIAFASLLLATLVLATTGCGKEGSEGTKPLDCGSHGTEHDGHCHCDSGYLFDGDTCVTPDEIDEVCVADEEVEGTEGEEEHDHAACRCPGQGVCPCEEGTTETIGDGTYCIPELHDE